MEYGVRAVLAIHPRCYVHHLFHAAQSEAIYACAARRGTIITLFFLLSFPDLIHEMKQESRRAAVRIEIENLETFEKHGESYANADGRHGWRNPIRADTGPILEAITMAQKPQRILEIGTAHGLSALYFIAASEDWDAIEMDTIEFHEEVAAATQERMDHLGVPVRVICGEAGAVIREKLDNSRYDMVFFDAQKSLYHEQLLALIERGLIGPGTVLLADNVTDRQTQCQGFLDWFHESALLHRIVPTECGLLVCRLPENFNG